MIGMLLQARHHLGAEALHVDTGRSAGQRDLGGRDEFVGEVGVHRVALAWLDQPHEATQAQPGAFQHGQGDVDPPLVTGDVCYDLALFRHRRDRGDHAHECVGEVLNSLAHPAVQSRGRCAHR